MRDCSRDLFSPLRRASGGAPYWWTVFSLLACSGFSPVHAADPANSAPASNPTAPSTPPATSSKNAPALRVGFVPPPLEGTLSLGVYDKAGKLVRTLRSEAQAPDFTVALNGFVLTWDGKDDSGKTVAPGKYRFLGYAVGDLGVTGEAYHGNDWVTAEDAPHLSSFQSLAVVPNRQGAGPALELVGTDASGKLWRVVVPREKGAGAEWGEPAFEKLDKTPDEAGGPTSCAVKGGGRWSIEKVLGETLVVQFDAQGEVVRRLTIGAGEPVPVAVAAPEEGEEVYLLEKDAAGTRVRLRGLRKRAAGEAASGEAGRPVWETFFERNRWPADRFETARARLGRPKPFTPEKKIRVQSQPNPLLGDATSPVDLAVSHGASGSYLCTADGLPLRRLTETSGLLWAVVGTEGKSMELTVFQSDGSVVEEYRIAQPSALMSFDAGEYPWPPK
jgi:hypothetical protein